MRAILEAVERYYAQGLCVLPCLPGQKRPAIDWKPFQERRPSLEEALELFERVARQYGDAPNIAVLLGRVSGGLVALDVDDLQYFFRWLSELGCTIGAEVPYVRTPSGGLHFYFRMPQGITFTRAIKLKDGAEAMSLRGDNHITILPPSVVGVPYVWVKEFTTLDEVPELYPWLIHEFELIRKPVAEAQPRVVAAAMTNGEWTEELVKTLLPHWTNGKRHMVALGVAGLLYKRGVPEEVAAQTIRRITELAGDPEVRDRLQAVVTTYHSARSVAGASILQQVLDGDTYYKVLRTVPQPATLQGSTTTLLQELLEMSPLQYDEQHLVRLLLPILAGRFAYHHAHGWYRYDGRRYELVDPAEVVRAVDDLLYHLRQDALQYCNPEETKTRKLLAFLERVAKPVTLERMIRILLAAQMSAAGFEPLSDPTKLAVGNGVLDLNTLTLIPYSPELHVTAMTTVNYNPAAEAPLWQEFLSFITEGDAELQDYLQLALGYSIAGAGEQERLFICFGTGANGKTTFLRVLLGVLQEHAGIANSASLASERLAESIARPDLLDIVTKRLVTTSELSEGGKFVEHLIKTIAGRTPLAMRRLYSNTIINVTPTCAIWLDTNYLPSMIGSDYGIWRRLEIIPFKSRVENPDPRLEEKLLREAEGILRWLVEGAHRYLKLRTLPEPAAVRRAKEQHRHCTDSVLAFVDARVAKRTGARVKRDELYSVYTEWCDRNALEPVGRNTFNRKMRTLGYTDIKSEGYWYWEGIALV